jgi:hypothetical protein
MQDVGARFYGTLGFDVPTPARGGGPFIGFDRILSVACRHNSSIEKWIVDLQGNPRPTTAASAQPEIGVVPEPIE